MTLLDSFGRTIRYLRVSVTDRCNLRCDYCRLVEEPIVSNQQLLSLEEITRLVRLFVELGVDRIRLTGGEPLLRRNVLTLVRELGSLSGLGELSLTTNGVLLARLARPLREAGLQRVNISLDTLTPEIFTTLTRGGALDPVLEGIREAQLAGLHPVKINMVVMRGVNDHEISPMIAFAVQNGLILRFIETMPIGPAGQMTAERFVSSEEILARIRQDFGGDLDPVHHAKEPGSGPARYFRVQGMEADVGVISARSRHFCDTCNRMRLTSKGALVLCLGATDRVDLLPPMRAGATDAQMKELIQAAVNLKPSRHHFDEGLDLQKTFAMSALGG